MLLPVIGLEIHLQLNTSSKLFCACKNGGEGESPNNNVCAICLGHPGTLPLLNKTAVEKVITLGLALKGNIAQKAKFDRKNYFYPDLPKAYQISQFDLPIVENGELNGIRIERAHLEEDAGKNIHGTDGKTFVDFNRAGAPLCEIVTKPDFTSAAQAKAFLEELQVIARTIDVSFADLEKGQMRCDVNISLREEGSSVLYPKTEIKNLNSFRNVERAILFEITRQTNLWEAGTPPQHVTTRGWNDTTGETEFQRSKETSADYRFFPEPDLPPLDLAEITATIRLRLPELPSAKRARFINEYNLKPADADIIIANPALANFTENALSELGAWLEAQGDVTADNLAEARQKVLKTFTTWLITKLPTALGETRADISNMLLTAENFAEFVVMVYNGKITALKGTEVLAAMLKTGEGPENAAQSVGVSNHTSGELESIINAILSQHPTEVTRYKNGETKLLAFFLGLVMRASKGNAAPEETTKILKEKLS